MTAELFLGVAARRVADYRRRTGSHPHRLTLTPDVFGAAELLFSADGRDVVDALDEFCFDHAIAGGWEIAETPRRAR